MVTLRFVVDDKPAAQITETHVTLSNTDGGNQMRSPWPFVTAKLTKEQAQALLRHLQEAVR